MKPRRKNHLRLVQGSKKGPPSVVLEVDDITPEGIREAFIVRFGPRCAAWLVNRFRRTVLRRGFFLAHVRADQEEPPWFQIAIGYLKTRVRKWEVIVWRQGRERRYRVAWTGGKPRGLPPVLRRVV